MTISPKLISVQVGMPRLIEGSQPWTSGFIKTPIAEPLWLGRTNLEGDGQADLIHHGGADKAVCVYPAAHYEYWRQQLRRHDFFGGSFGENFTVSQLVEQDVCIGDVWTMGDAALQISQPRQPCWKLARRWGVKDLALQVQETGRTGWYFRVLTEGIVQRGMPLQLADRQHPTWTIAEANRIMHHDKHDREAAALLAAIPYLSDSWKSTLTNRIEKNIEPETRKRLNPAD